MDWTAQIDGYCERLDGAFWAEPLNAWTNLAFLLAAWVMARRLRGARMQGARLPLARALVAVLAAYKDFSAPLRELFRHYQGAQDVFVRYEDLLRHLAPREAPTAGVGRG